MHHLCSSQRTSTIGTLRHCSGGKCHGELTRPRTSRKQLQPQFRLQNGCEPRRAHWLGVSEWFCRPADERYLSLNELACTVRDRADRSRTRVVDSALIHVEASRTDPEPLALILPGSGTPVDAAPLELRPACKPGWRAGRLPAAASRGTRSNQPDRLTANRVEQIKNALERAVMF